MYEFTLHTVPPITFAGYEVAAVGAANAAINGELPNLAITLDNARGDHTQIMAAADVLRARAELAQDGAVVFTGAVQAVTLGASITVDLEA